MHTPPLNHVLEQVPTSQVNTSQTCFQPCNLGHPIGIQINRPYAWRIVVNFFTNLIGAKLSHRDRTWGTLCQDKWTNHSGLRKPCCSYNILVSIEPSFVCFIFPRLLDFNESPIYELKNLWTKLNPFFSCKPSNFIAQCFIM